MGNEFSSSRKISKLGNSNSVPYRVPLSALDNQENIPQTIAPQQSVPPKKRPYLEEATSKKRTRAHIAQTQPAGSHCNPGTIGSRWPIHGINADSLNSQGILHPSNLSNESEDNVINWRLDVDEFTKGYLRNNDGIFPRSISSRIFNFHPVGSRLRWKLMIVLCDLDDDSISIYLESINSRDGETFIIETHFTLFLGVTELNHRHDASIRHTFTSRQPLWGIQNVACFNEVAELMKDGELKIGLRFKWLRDSRLFPAQFLTLHAHHPELYKLCESPKIMMMENFLTMDECEALIRSAEPHLYRSRVASGTETPSRTSSSMFFIGKLERVEIVKAFHKKLLHFISLPDIHENRNIEPTESLQAVRYHVGEFYSEHYDNKAGMSALRAATIIVYLKDTDAGGATYFPKASRYLPNGENLTGSVLNKHYLRKNGLRIYPRRGRALFFWSRLANGEEDRNALHSAESVVDGEKWIATRWLRELDPSV